MRAAFDDVVDFYAARLLERRELSAQPGRASFDGTVCRVRTKVIRTEGFLMERLRGDDASALRLLKDEALFADEPFDRAVLRALFWAFQMTVLDHWDSVTRVDAHEESQNSALMAHLCSSLRLLGLLDDRAFGGGEFVLYGADCRSDWTESRLGCDFALIVPIGPDLYKVALFQAKKAAMEGLTSIERESPKDSRFQQLTRLLQTERAYATPRDVEAGLFGRLAYYAFWHDPRTQLLPTVLSAAQANGQLRESSGVDYSRKNLIGAMARNPDMRVCALAGGTWFSEAIPLLLADPTSDFGVIMGRRQVRRLFQSKATRPRQVVGMRIPGRGLSLGDWRDLMDEDLVLNERFFRNGHVYEGRAAFDAALRPSAGSRP